MISSSELFECSQQKMVDALLITDFVAVPNVQINKHNGFNFGYWPTAFKENRLTTQTTVQWLKLVY